MNVIAIDIGGTEIKYGLVNFKGEISFSSSLLTEPEKGVEELLQKIYWIINQLKNNMTKGIAVSATGQINGIIGKVIGGTNLIPGWIGTNLVDILEKKYNLSAILENDVNCASLGEMWLGAGKKHSDFLCLTIGTGIGGGIILNKKLVRGAGNVAGEFGHLMIVKNGDVCGCGNKGCFQQYASTTALIKMIEHKTGKKLNGKDIFNEIHKKNIIFTSIFDKWIDYLTDGLSNLIYIFNPALIIIGGGISKQGDFLKEKIYNSLKNKVMKNYLDDLEIKMAEKGNDSGMLGATYLLLEKLDNY